MSTGRIYSRQWKHDGSAYGAVLTKDERRIHSRSHDRTLRLWDAATCQQLGPAIGTRLARM
jgi:hypothetical protein